MPNLSPVAQLRALVSFVSHRTLWFRHFKFTLNSGLIFGRRSSVVTASAWAVVFTLEIQDVNGLHPCAFSDRSDVEEDEEVKEEEKLPSEKSSSKTKPGKRKNITEKEANAKKKKKSEQVSCECQRCVSSLYETTDGKKEHSWRTVKNVCMNVWVELFKESQMKGCQWLLFQYQQSDSTIPDRADNNFNFCSE